MIKRLTIMLELLWLCIKETVDSIFHLIGSLLIFFPCVLSKKYFLKVKNGRWG